MRSLHMFIVELDKPINDTISTASGMELYIDTRFEGGEFAYRVTDGPVLSTPAKHDTGVKPGDTLYFHHLVVMQEGQKLTGNDKSYFVNYDPTSAVNNQAIAYKNKKGDIIPLAGWSLLLPVEEEEDDDGVIEVVSLKEELPTKGMVAFESEEIKELGLKVGDVVGFKENRDYRIKIDGKEYYRTRIMDLMYVEEEVHND
jgi:co-chaperonin GroES (HSP10)